jgi:ankyrin repeat protein
MDNKQSCLAAGELSTLTKWWQTLKGNQKALGIIDRDSLFIDRPVEVSGQKGAKWEQRLTVYGQVALQITFTLETREITARVHHLLMDQLGVSPWKFSPPSTLAANNPRIQAWALQSNPQLIDLALKCLAGLLSAKLDSHRGAENISQSGAREMDESEADSQFSRGEVIAYFAFGRPSQIEPEMRACLFNKMAPSMSEYTSSCVAFLWHMLNCDMADALSCHPLSEQKISACSTWQSLYSRSGGVTGFQYVRARFKHRQHYKRLRDYGHEPKTALLSFVDHDQYHEHGADEGRCDTSMHLPNLYNLRYLNLHRAIDLGSYGAMVATLKKCQAHPNDVALKYGVDQFDSLPTAMQSCIHVVFSPELCLDLLTNALDTGIPGMIMCLLRVVPNESVESLSIMSQNSKGVTPLMAAAAAGSFRMVQWLTQKNVDPSAVDHHGRTALMYALEYGPEQDSLNEVVECLLNHEAHFYINEEGPSQSNREANQACINVKDKSGCTALMRAAGRSSRVASEHKLLFVKIIEELLRHGANPNQVDANGQMAINKASSTADDPIKRVLLEVTKLRHRGFEVNVRVPDGLFLVNEQGQEFARLDKNNQPQLIRPTVVDRFRFFTKTYKQPLLICTAIAALVTAVAQLAKWENRDTWAQVTHLSALVTAVAWVGAAKLPNPYPSLVP